MTILYRGQSMETRVSQGGPGVISPVARSLPPDHPDLLPDLQGVDRSNRLYEQLTTGNYADSDGPVSPGYLAHATTVWNDQALPGPLRPPIDSELPGSLVDPRIGGVGIPTTQRPGIAANPEWTGANDQGVVYVIRIRADQAVPTSSTNLHQELEFVIFNEIPEPNIYRTLEPSEYPPGLTIDENTSNLKLTDPNQ